MEDREIVQLFLLRNEDAISETDLRYGHTLKRIAGNIVPSAEDADECVNDTYLSCWNAVPPKDPSDYFFPFLVKITRNLSIDRVRKEKALEKKAVFIELTDELITCIPSGEEVEGRLLEDEMKHILNRALRKLPAENRQIFVRRYFYMDSMKEIAKRFGISESKAKITLFRVRKVLAHEFEKEGYLK